MAKTTLTPEHTRALVHQLATNDEFRSLFESNPAAALTKLGVPEATIHGLDDKCMMPKKLGSKAVFQAANANLDAATAQLYSAFMVPAVSLDPSK